MRKGVKQSLEKANQINNTEKIYILQTENTRLKLENLKLIKRYKALSIKVDDYDILVEPNITQEDVNSYGNIITSLKKIMKNTDGMYDIGEKQYELLEGTRQEVWDGKAYKTSGGLLKHNLIINKLGNIVSKRKSMSETVNKRLVVCGVNKPSVESDI